MVSRHRRSRSTHAFICCRVVSVCTLSYYISMTLNPCEEDYMSLALLRYTVALRRTRLLWHLCSSSLPRLTYPPCCSFLNSWRWRYITISSILSAHDKNCRNPLPSLHLDTFGTWLARHPVCSHESYHFNCLQENGDHALRPIRTSKLDDSLFKIGEHSFFAVRTYFLIHKRSFR